MKRLLTLLAACLALSSHAATLPARVVLVGDSTMNGRTGYGDALCQRMAPDTACINLARGGRSSSSFRAEGRWDEVQSLLRDQRFANYVLIQFGHNDQPGKPGRSTDLVSEFPANMARYAAEVRAGGGVPVLVTPLTRRSFKGAWLDNDLAPWAAATRQVAAADKSVLLDLNKLSADAVQAMGSAQADTLASASNFDRTHLGDKGAAYFADMVAGELHRLIPAIAIRAAAGPAKPPDWMHERAPQDGWGGGARGGSEATAANTITVSTRAELMAALARDVDSRIIFVNGVIDMSDGRPYASSAEQNERGVVRLGSNTSLIGLGPNAGFINASIVIAGVSQVIVRNLHIHNPCDVGPVWDPRDDITGNWNSLFDGISIVGAQYVWIDHNSFTDAPVLDQDLPVENGMTKQCHDGALDITKGADFITVSYNRFSEHEKNMLIGSGDKSMVDAGHLKVTLHHNWFDNIAARSPRVRYGQVHVFNNYYTGDRKATAYSHKYSIGVGVASHIISANNAFDIAGAASCADIVYNWDKTPPSAAFFDTGSLVNGGALAGCTFNTDVGWTVPYPFTALPAAAVKDHVTRNAGAGKLTNPLVMVPRDFHSIQSAVDFVTHQYHRATPVTIQIANGNYEELLVLRGKDNLTLQGESRDGVVIHALNNAGLNTGGTRSVFLVEDADLLTVQQLTIRNDTVRADTKGAQAETLLFNSNGRLIVKDASFFSEQDTLQLKGYAWFYRTLVSGNVDFIWGANHVALFEESEIRSVGDSSKANAGGYVLQARTVNRDDKGFVFLNSILTHGPGPRGNDIEPGKTYLARSSGKSANWDNIAFINCRMDEHVAPRGWAGGGEKLQPAPNPAQANAASGWREYGSMDMAGKPLDLSQRVGGYVMSASEVKAQFPSRAAILGWNPL